jgi:hypothetical protein
VEVVFDDQSTPKDESDDDTFLKTHGIKKSLIL